MTPYLLIVAIAWVLSRVYVVFDVLLSGIMERRD